MPLIFDRRLSSDLEHAAHLAIGVVADAQGAGRRRLLHARRDVDRDAADAAFRVDAAAQQDRAGVDADAHAEAVDAVLALEPRARARRLPEDVETGADGALGVVLEGAVGTEDGEHAVARVLEDLALLLDDDGRQPLERAVHHGVHVFGIEMLAEAGRADDVHEKHGHRLQLRLALRALAQGGELFLQRGDSHPDDHVAEHGPLRLEGGDGRLNLLRVVFHASNQMRRRARRRRRRPFDLPDGPLDRGVHVGWRRQTGRGPPGQTLHLRHRARACRCSHPHSKGIPMSFKLVPLVAALTLAGSAHAITVNMTDFTYGSPVAATMTGTGGSPSYGGSAGAFTGSLSDSPSPDARRSSLGATSSPTSFVAWCVELTQSFNFGVDYQYSMLDGSSYTFGNLANDPNDHRLTDLSRLFTAASQNHFVFNSAGSAAFQAGIWEIVYEHDFSTLGYSLTSGSMIGRRERSGQPGRVQYRQRLPDGPRQVRRRLPHRHPRERQPAGLPGRLRSGARDLGVAASAASA